MSNKKLYLFNILLGFLGSAVFTPVFYFSDKIPPISSQLVFILWLWAIALPFFLLNLLSKKVRDSWIVEKNFRSLGLSFLFFSLGTAITLLPLRYLVYLAFQNFLS